MSIELDHSSDVELWKQDVLKFQVLDKQRAREVLSWQKPSKYNNETREVYDNVSID